MEHEETTLGKIVGAMPYILMVLMGFIFLIKYYVFGQQI